MKTAISMPDDLFYSLEELAARLDKSRSELYREAVVEYLARHGTEEVTEALNKALDQLAPQTQNPFVSAAAQAVLRRSEW